MCPFTTNVAHVRPDTAYLEKARLLEKVVCNICKASRYMQDLSSCSCFILSGHQIKEIRVSLSNSIKGGIKFTEGYLDLIISKQKI